jgi:ketosteroid isomerase-like protein
MKELAIVAAMLTITFTSCGPEADIGAEKAVLRAVVDSLEIAFETNSTDLLGAVISNGSDNVFFGTDSAERFVGYEAFIEAHKRLFASIDRGSTIASREVVVDIDKTGDAAWMSFLMDWEGKSQGQAFSFEGLRFTAVLEKQNGKWEIVHLHGSVPVSGQAVRY